MQLRCFSRSIRARSGFSRFSPLQSGCLALRCAPPGYFKHSISSFSRHASKLSQALYESPRRYRSNEETRATRAEQSDIDLDAPWGFVVFRAVYGKKSDGPWAQMLESIRDVGASHPTEPWDLDLPFELTVINDETKLEGADPHTVREAFRKWVADDLPPRVRRPDMYGGVNEIRTNIENSTVSELWHYAQRPLHPWYWVPPRWSFCLLVDDFCLRSLDDSKNIPVVKLVNLHYFKDRCRSIADGWEDGETADDPYEDVGWQYMHITDYGACYDALSDPTNWDDEVWYHRPAKSDYPLAIDF